MAVAGADFVNQASSYVGDPYVYGAEGPSSFDCSGLVEYTAAQFGITVPRTTSQMTASSSPLIPIGRKDLGPGDLIFSNWGDGPNSHVGIFTGDGSIIEAPKPGENVRVTTLGDNYWAHATSFRRIPGVDTGGTATLSGANTPGIPGVLNGIAGFIPNPSSILDVGKNISASLGQVGQAAIGVGNVATMVTKAFLPSNLLRGTLFIFGTVFILLGVWHISREVRSN